MSLSWVMQNAKKALWMYAHVHSQAVRPDTGRRESVLSLTAVRRTLPL